MRTKSKVRAQSVNQENRKTWLSFSQTSKQPKTTNSTPTYVYSSTTTSSKTPNDTQFLKKSIPNYRKNLPSLPHFRITIRIQGKLSYGSDRVDSAGHWHQRFGGGGSCQTGHGSEPDDGLGPGAQMP